MKGYREAGFLGALVGINLFVSAIGFDPASDLLFANHVTEALGFGFIASLLYDILPYKRSKNIFKVAGVALVTGVFWEIFSFLAWGKGTGEIISSWFAFATPTIFLIGVPIMAISDVIRETKEWGGIHTVGNTGQVFNFVVCMGVAILLFAILLKLGIYVDFAHFFGYERGAKALMQFVG